MLQLPTRNVKQSSTTSFINPLSTSASLHRLPTPLWVRHPRVPVPDYTMMTVEGQFPHSTLHYLLRMITYRCTFYTCRPSEQRSCPSSGRQTKGREFTHKFTGVARRSATCAPTIDRAE